MQGSASGQLAQEGSEIDNRQWFRSLCNRRYKVRDLRAQARPRNLIPAAPVASTASAAAARRAARPPPPPNVGALIWRSISSFLLTCCSIPMALVHIDVDCSATLQRCTMLFRPDLRTISIKAEAGYEVTRGGVGEKTGTTQM